MTQNSENAKQSEDALLDMVMDEIMLMQDKNLRPSLDDFLQRYPSLESELRELFPTLQLLQTHEWANASPPPLGKTIAESSINEFPKILGDFELHGEIGRGGMGVVFSATQVSLVRPVALKVLSRHLSTNPKFTARFLRESQSAARLQHPNIVQVFGNGKDKGLFFYAMQLIQGQSLDRVLIELQILTQHGKRDMLGKDWHTKSTALPLSNLLGKKGLLELYDSAFNDGMELAGINESTGRSAETLNEGLDGASNSKKQSRKRDSSEPRFPSTSMELSGVSSRRYYTNVARLAKSVASAIHYAHLHGVIHRDIKPSNLILDESGTIWVTDFGLAKLKSESDLTQSGDMMGTLRYMAPEQLAGESGPSCDIYSLGATLYEMLTLQSVIRSDKRAEMMQQVRERDPISPRSIDPRIPVDLETLTLKALDKDPRKRFQTGEEFADELQRFLEGRPILSRPTSWLERTTRWAKRNRLLASTLLLMVLGLIFVSVGSMIAAIVFRDLASQAEIANEETRQRLYISEMNNGLQSVGMQGGLKLQREILNRWRPRSGEADLRGWEWFYLQSHANQEELVVPAGNQANSFTCSRKAGVIAWYESKRVHICSLKTMQKKTIDADGRHLISLQFDPNGTRLASVDQHNTICIWDLTELKLVQTLPALGKIQYLQWNPDGKSIAGLLESDTKNGGSLVVTNLETGESQTVIPDSICYFSSRFCFNSDGSRFAAPFINKHNYGDASIQIWNTKNWEMERKLARPVPTITALKWSPNDDRIAASSSEGGLDVWNATNGEKTFQTTLTRSITDFAWSPDGKRLAGGCTNATTMIWDMDKGRLTDNLLQNQVPIAQIEFTEESNKLVTLEDSGRVCIWNPDLRTAERSFRLANQLDARQIDVSISWNHDSTYLAAGAAFPTNIWSMTSGKSMHSIVGSYAHWSFDGRYIATKY